MDLFDVVSEPRRRSIMALLGELGDASVSELASRLPVTRPAVSQHLAILAEAGIVAARAEGRERRYYLLPDGVAASRAAVETFLVAELDRLESVAAQRLGSNNPDQQSAISNNSAVTRDSERNPIMSDPIVVERHIAASPDQAFALLSEPEQLRRWQVVSASVDLRAGGNYRFTVTPGHIATGEFTEIVPGKLLRYTWGWQGSDGDASTVTIELTPDGDGTLVRLIHEGLEGDARTSHTEGWNHYMDRLQATAAGDDEPDPWAVGGDDVDHLSAMEASYAVCQQVLRQLTSDDRERATPCSEFTVHDLVEHLAGSIRGLGAVAGANVPDQVDAASAEDYIAQLTEPMLAAWRARGTDGEVPFGSENAPAVVPAGIASLEFLVHAWDVAQAMNQQIKPSPTLVEFVDGVARMVITPEVRVPERFGDPKPEPSDDPLGALIAFTGRSAVA